MLLNQGKEEEEEEEVWNGEKEWFDEEYNLA